MTLCLSCNRGQVYCGLGCSDEARKQGLAEAQARYLQTERGREKNRGHQQAYRDRMQGIGVSDQCSGPVSPPIEPSEQRELAVASATETHKEGVQNEMSSEIRPQAEAGKSKACRLCGQVVTHLLSDSDWRVWRRQRRDKWLTQRHRRRSAGYSMSSI